MVAQTSQQRGQATEAQAGQRVQNNQPEPLQDLGVYLRDYAAKQPEMAALWCLGIGFVLGWKMRAW